MNSKTALFIGRFQPFHNGHLSVVKSIYAEFSNIIIGIGSAEDNYLPENPFTAGERYEMIKAVLLEEKMDLARIAIIPVRNINNYALWVRHVELLLPKFEVVYTGSNIVTQLFEEDGKYEVKPVKKKIEINATLVRQKILKGEDYSNFLPSAVEDYLNRIHAQTRIKNIN